MTRVLIIHPRPTRGGFSAVVAQCRELAELGGFDVTVAVGDGDRVAELEGLASVELLRLPLTGFRGLIGLARVIRRSRPEVLHLHGRQAGVLGRVLMGRARPEIVLYTPHGTPWTGSSWSKPLVSDLVERVLLRTTSYVLCVSRAEQADWVRRDRTERVLYFPNAIDLDDGAAPGSATSAPSRRCEVLVPSGYHPQKRIEVVIGALALLPAPRPSVVVTGTVDDSSYLASLRRLAERLGVAADITFAGNASDIRTLMRHAGLVVLPSYSEGLPIVGQEAISVGANVAWSTIAPHAELFADAGAPFWSAEELAAVISGDRAAASVARRRGWLSQQQQLARHVRADFWRSLAGSAI